MATVTIPNTFSPGGTILSSEVNANFTAITDQVNGSLDANNLANSAVGENQLGNLSVATAKIQALAVTDAKVASGIDAVKIGGGLVDNTEFGYLNGVTSAIQTQLNTLDSDKQDVITGAASTVVAADLTANRAVVSSGTGKLDISAVTATELGYVSGVTSAIQTQLNTLDTDKLDATATAADSQLLDSLNSTQFLRSDTSDSFTTGTLTFSASTTLDLSAAALILPSV